MVERTDISGGKQTHKRRNAGLILFQKRTWEQPDKKKNLHAASFVSGGGEKFISWIETNKVTMTQHVCGLINQFL